MKDRLVQGPSASGHRKGLPGFSGPGTPFGGKNPEAESGGTPALLEAPAVRFPAIHHAFSIGARLAAPLRLLAVLFSLALPLPCRAQQPAQPSAPSKGSAKEKDRKQTRIVRLLAVGEVPVFRATLRNGVLREAEPKPGTLPPLEVSAQIDDEEPALTRVMLGSISPPRRIPQAMRTLRLFKTGAEASGAPPWVSATLPEGADPLLVVVWRDPKTGKWTRARSLVLRDGADTSPPRSVRVLNVTRNPVAVRFGKESKPVVLRPGRSALRKTTPGSPLPIAVAMANGKNGWIRLYRGQADPAADERVRIIIYRSDGESVRRPAKAAVITERIR